VIELWHEWNSVHSFKVRVVLAEKKIQWVDRRVELLKLEHLQPAYLAINPSGVVPTLRHDGRTIFESSVICQYLDEAFPGPALMPTDPLDRARARAWLKYFDDVLHPALRALSFERLYRPLLASLPRDELERRLASHPDPKRAQSYRQPAGQAPDTTPLTKAVGRIEAALEHEWLAGEAFGMADVALAPFVERLEHLGMSGILSPVKDWSARILARPSVQAARAPEEFRFKAAPGRSVR
jgi:glutathione S-transferase